MVGTNAPPRACVCEMESQCVWGEVRDRWSLSVCIGGCVHVCVCVAGSSVADVI